MERISSFYKSNKLLTLVGAAVALGGVGYAAYKFVEREGKPGAQLNTKLTDPKYKEEFPLTKEEAEARANIIGEVKYHVGLYLKRGEEYEGKVTATFKVLK